MEMLTGWWAEVLELLGERTWVIEVFVVVLGTLVAMFVARRLLDALRRKARATHNIYDDALFHAGRRPLAWLVAVVGLAWAAEIAFAGADAELQAMVPPARLLGVIFLLALFGVRFVTFIEEHITTTEYREVPVDETTAQALGKLVRLSIIITAVLTAMQSLGFSIAGVLAFGGIGGIAVGFAAKDLLANFFGGMMIFLDRPFSVGDWVRSPDQDIEGTVEHIGWRLTRIRTFDQRPLYVPNATFTQISVENPSRMLNRRIYEVIGVRYDDVDAVAAIVGDIEAYLKDHEAIDLGRTLIVNVLRYGPSSIDIMVYTFTKTVVWTEYHAIKQDVLLGIGRIIAEHGAEIAFPTQTLHVASAPPAEPEPAA